MKKTKKEAFSKLEKLLLRHFAGYVWWKNVEDIITHESYRIIAGAMLHLNTKEGYIKLLGLKKTLQEAQVGWFDKKSWLFGMPCCLVCRKRFPNFQDKNFSAIKIRYFTE